MSGGAWFFVYRGFLGVGFVDPRVRSFIALMTRPPCLRAVLSCLKYLGGSNVISPAGLMRMIRVPWSTANPSSCCVWCGVILVVMFVTCVLLPVGWLHIYYLIVSINSSGAVIMCILCYQNMNMMTAPVPHEDIKNNHRRQQDGNPPTLRAPPFHIRAQATSGRS